MKIKTHICRRWITFFFFILTISSFQSLFAQRNNNSLDLIQLNGYQYNATQMEEEPILFSIKTDFKEENIKTSAIGESVSCTFSRNANGNKETMIRYEKAQEGLGFSLSNLVLIKSDPKAWSNCQLLINGITEQGEKIFPIVVTKEPKNTYQQGVLKIEKWTNDDFLVFFKEPVVEVLIALADQINDDAIIKLSVGSFCVKGEDLERAEKREKVEKKDCRTKKIIVALDVSNSVSKNELEKGIEKTTELLRSLIAQGYAVYGDFISFHMVIDIGLEKELVTLEKMMDGGKIKKYFDGILKEKTQTNFSLGETMLTNWKIVLDHVVKMEKSTPIDDFILVTDDIPNFSSGIKRQSANAFLSAFKGFNNLKDLGVLPNVLFLSESNLEDLNSIANFILEEEDHLESPIALFYNTSELLLMLDNMNRNCNLEKEKEKESLTKISPNPSTGQFVIDGQFLEPRQIIVKDSFGKKIKSIQTEKNAFLQIDLSEETAGVYLILISNLDGTNLETHSVVLIKE